MKNLYMTFAILVLLAGCCMSCTWNFRPSYWRESQKNFHRVNADNRVYHEYIRHTTYPGTSANEYCERVWRIPHRGRLTEYGYITGVCRAMFFCDEAPGECQGPYENPINELKELLKSLDEGKE